MSRRYSRPPGHASAQRSDGGFTLIEMTVAIGVFLIFVACAIPVLISVTRTMTNAENSAWSSSAAISALSSLDHQVRYADSINFPGTGASGDDYIEFRVPANRVQASSVAVCYQWMFNPNADTLGYRTWNSGAAISAATPWHIEVEQVNGSVTSSYPFTLIPAAASGPSMQQLAFSVNAGPTTGSSANLAVLSATFDALNSSVSSPSNADVNVNAVSDTPVCNPAGYRS